jgi:hypothetical protein
MNVSFLLRQNPSNEKFTSHSDQDLKLKNIRYLQLFRCFGRLIISYYLFNQSGTSNCIIPAELSQVISEINLYLPGNYTPDKTLQFLGKNNFELSGPMDSYVFYPLVHKVPLSLH